MFHSLIRLDGIPPHVGNQELMNVVRPFGAVAAKVNRGDHFAIVSFENEQAATNGTMAARRAFGGTMAGQASPQDRVWFYQSSDRQHAQNDPYPTRGRGGHRGSRGGSHRGSGRGIAATHHAAATPAPMNQNTADVYASAAPVAKLNLVQDLGLFPFFLIEFEYAHIEGTTYVPCEVSILKLNVKEGEKAIFHRFIDPGTLSSQFVVLHAVMISYSSLTRLGSHINTTLWRQATITGIPHDHRFDDAEKNYSKLWTEICDFLGFPIPSKWTHGTQLPSLYAKKPFAKCKALQWIADKTDFPNPFGEVKPIEEMIWFLHTKKNVEIKTSEVQLFFAKLIEATMNPNDRDRTRQLRCDYHKKPDVEKSTAKLSCSLSVVRILGNMLRKINDDLTNGTPTF